MDLNKLMQMILEHHHKQEILKLQYDMAFELLARTFIRTVPPVQREHELSLSKQEVLEGMENLEGFQEEIFLELIGNAKNMVIDMADKIETQ